MTGQRKVLEKPLMIGIAALVVLAIATVVVIVTKDARQSNVASSNDGSTSSGAIEKDVYSDSGASSTSASTSTSTDGYQTITVTIDNFGISYKYPADVSQNNGGSWIELGDVALNYNGVDLKLVSAVGFADCTGTGNDVLVGVIESDESDLGKASASVLKDGAPGLFDSGFDPTLGKVGDPVTGSTNSGLDGYLSEADLTLSKKDACDSTEIHVGTFAVRNTDGKTIVMFASYRDNGTLTGDHADYVKFVIGAFKSIETI